MTAPGVAFLGGNGHCAWRLAAAREALAQRGIALHDVPYPGFELRPRAPDREAFLTATLAAIPAAPLVYATGIGGLLALCLRARGALRDRRLLLQAPVLWGIERRWMPRLMRLAAARRAAQLLFAAPAFQARFARRHFQRPLAVEERSAFFEGYRHCASFGDLFAWLSPALLRRLESAFGADPHALQGIETWWGERDHVVGLEELRRTEATLGVRWPLQQFPGWGHYPMIDVPQKWADTLASRVQELGAWEPPAH
jgi:pimeloyl-ACP methyl ester carboxylesterase